MLEWAAHFKYLQSILLEYDLIKVLAKLTILKYFWKGLKPSILAELQNEDFKLESFVQIVKKAVITKAKASLRPWATAWDID